MKDKDKCVAYLQTKFSGLGEENANTICSGGAVDGVTLKDVVQQGGIPSSDYETAGLEVNWYNGGGTDVVIPSMINGKKVVAIADYAFTSDGIIPTTISNTKKASISYLYNIDNKKKVTLLNDQPQNIGLGITSVVIPNTVTSIGEHAFYDNRLVELVIPSTVKSIGRSAFKNNKLTEVTIPSSVISIGDWAFAGNRDITIINNSSIENSIDVWDNIIGTCSINGNVITYLPK